MLTRRTFLAAGTTAAALAATPYRALAQTPRRQMRDAVPPTSPSPVSARPSDNLGGTTVAVGSNAGDLRDALNGAGAYAGRGALNPDGSHRGNTYVCPAGAVYGGAGGYPYIALQLPATTVTTGYTCIRVGPGSLPSAGTTVGPSNTGGLFKVVSPGALNDARAVASPFVGGDYGNAFTGGWRFVGMEATHPNDAYTYATVELHKASRMSFERCYFHRHSSSQSVRRSFYIIDASDLQFWDCWLDGYENGSDSQCLGVRSTTRLHVEHCELQALGENILLSDQDAPGPADDVTMRRNHFFKPLSWHRFLEDGSPNPAWDGVSVTVKNLCEIKWGHRVFIEGNTLENMWRGAQDGTAVLIYSGVSSVRFQQTTDVLFQNNALIRVGNAFTSTFGTGGGERSVGARAARVAFLNNLIRQCNGRLTLANWGTDDLWLEHNTCVPMAVAGHGIVIQTVGVDSAFPRMTVRRNVFGRGPRGMGVRGADYVAQREVEVDAVWANSQFHVPDRDWRENAVYGGATSTPGFTGYASAAAAGVDLATGHLASTSPLKVGQPGYVGTDGKDLGVDVVALNAAQTGE